MVNTDFHLPVPKKHDGLFSIIMHRLRVYNSVSQKIPPDDLWQFFQNGWEFFNQILITYYAFPSTLGYEFLFNYIFIMKSYSEGTKKHKEKKF